MGNKRRYERIVLPHEKSIPCEGVNREFAGRVLVIGSSGMYVLSSTRLPVGTEIELRVLTEAEPFELSCVVRTVEPGGMGVEFVWLSAAIELKLRRYLNRLRKEVQV